MGALRACRAGRTRSRAAAQNRCFILRIPDNYDNSRPYRLIFGVPLERRHRERRRLRRHRRDAVVLLRAAAPVEQRRDLRRAAGPQQRLGQFRRPGRHLRRRHDRAVGGRSVRRHHAAFRPRVQLRRRHELRPRLRAADGLPRGRGLLRWRSSADAAAARSLSPTSASTASPTRSSTSPQGGRCATGSSRNNGCTAAERARTGLGQPDAHRHHLLRLQSRVSGRVGGVRRRPHPRPDRRVHQRRLADLDFGSDLGLLHPVPVRSPVSEPLGSAHPPGG